MASKQREKRRVPRSAKSHKILEVSFETCLVALLDEREAARKRVPMLTRSIKHMRKLLQEHRKQVREGTFRP